MLAPEAPSLASPQLGSRALFPDLEPRVYANHAGMSPPSLRVRAAVDALLGRYARMGGAAVTDALAVRGRVRSALAALVGVAPSDVALTNGVSHGLLAVALSFPWRRGDRVVLFDGEFPANVAPWLRAAELFGLEPVFLPASDFLEDPTRGLARVEDAVRAGARLVAVSAVQFQTGLRMPLEALAAACHAHGAELCVDAIQAVGGLPLDARAAGVDYLAGGAHKWLMGIEGAGFLYVSPARVASLRPALAGWLSHEDPVSFLTAGRAGLLRYDRPLRRRADVFEGSSSGAAALAALEAALDTLATLGVEAVAAHVGAWNDRLEPGLRALGFDVLRTADAARRSGILSARPPPGQEARGIRDALSARGIAVAIPDGLVRFAPHWPNALHEVDEIIAALGGVP